MGSILFSDKIGDVVSLYYLPLHRDWEIASTYSWGSANLAFLYRQLCRACHKRAFQIGEAVMERLPEICCSDPHIWRTRAPLICFDIVELQLLDRVMRQFELEQSIAQGVDTSDALHKKDHRSQRQTIHRVFFTGYERADAVADIHKRLSRAMETISNLTPDKALPFAEETIWSLTTFCGDTLSRVGYSRLIEQPQVSSSHVHAEPIRPPPPRGGQSSRAFHPPASTMTPPLRTPNAFLSEGPSPRTTPYIRPPLVTPQPTPPPPPNPRPVAISQHTIVTSPPLVQRQYQRRRQRDTSHYGFEAGGLHDIPEEDGSPSPSSASLLGKKQRIS
ncbi:Serine/threonine-protein phosphatase 7 long form-like protein [Bienertia sinuspersici]